MLLLHMYTPAVYSEATNIVTFNINTDVITNDVFNPTNRNNYFVIVFDDYASSVDDPIKRYYICVIWYS